MGTLACGRVETYTDDVDRIQETMPALAMQIVRFTGVGQVVDWISERRGERSVVDLMAMDEFEYDFLVEVDPGGSWLAFGVT